MSQTETIKQMLDTGDWVCATDILKSMFIVDYRARISKIKKELPQEFELRSIPCYGDCGTKHTAGMHKYRIVKK